MLVYIYPALVSGEGEEGGEGSSLALQPARCGVERLIAGEQLKEIFSSRLDSLKQRLFDHIPRLVSQRVERLSSPFMIYCLNKLPTSLDNALPASTEDKDFWRTPLALSIRQAYNELVTLPITQGNQPPWTELNLEELISLSEGTGANRKADDGAVVTPKIIWSIKKTRIITRCT